MQLRAWKQMLKSKTFLSILLSVFVLWGAVATKAQQGDHGAAAGHQHKPSQVRLTADEQAWLEEDHEVRVRVGNWPPFMMTDGQVRGIAIDYLERIFRRHGIRYRYVLGTEVSWKEALEGLKNRQAVDMVPTAKVTAERRQYMVFSDEYLFLPWVIFSRTDSPFISGIDDLQGKTVSVPEGYVMQQLLTDHYPDIALRVVSGDNAVSRCLQALALGEVDAYVGNLAVGSYLIQQEGYTNVKVASPSPFGNHNNAMGVRGDWPELAGIISKSLAAFAPEEKAAIWNHWLSVRYEHGLNRIDIVKWGLMAGGIAGAIILMVLIWNKHLAREIAVRKEVENRLRESEMKFKSLSQAAFEGIIISKDGVVLEINEAMGRMFGYAAAEAVGRQVVDFAVADDRDKVRGKIMSGDEGAYEVVFQKKDGTAFEAEVHARMFEYHGQQVRVTAVRDISVRKQAEREKERFVAELEKLATTDDLTGIANRKAFFRRMEEEINRCKRYDHNFSLAMLDLDNFKRFNDRYGHPAGDAVLKVFAARISDHIRSNDIFGRIGGEEFVILLPETSLQSAHAMLDKLRQMTEESAIVLPDGQRVHITVSAGVATSEEAGFEVDPIIKCADRRLYLAKNSGRNRVVSAD